MSDGWPCPVTQTLCDDCGHGPCQRLLPGWREAAGGLLQRIGDLVDELNALPGINARVDVNITIAEDTDA